MKDRTPKLLFIKQCKNIFQYVLIDEFIVHCRLSLIIAKALHWGTLLQILLASIENLLRLSRLKN